MSKFDWANDAGSSDDEDSVNEQLQNDDIETKNTNNEMVQQEQQEQQQQQAPYAKQTRYNNRSIPDRPPFFAYVANLNYVVTRDVLGDFFHNGGCKVKDVRIQLKEDGQSRGSAFVEFDDRASLERALEAHDEKLEGRRMSVSVADKNRRDKNKGREGKGGDRGPNRHDRGERREQRRGQDSREDWNRNEPRGDRGNKNASGAPPPPNPSSTEVPTRKKLELKPRQAPLETIGERVAQSSIFGEGRAREENLAISNIRKEVQEVTIESSKVTDMEVTPKASASSEAITGGDDDKKKGKEQKVSKDNNKERNTRDKKKDKERKGDKKVAPNPKYQDRKNGNGDGKVKKPKPDKGKEKDMSEEAARARFIAANEKMQKPVTTAPTKPKVVNTFFALMSDDSDSDSN